MSPQTESRVTCSFCDGTGLWIDRDADPTSADPCPLCEGRGTVEQASREAASSPDDALGRLLALLPHLSQQERQRLYEELHDRFGCRIYR